MKYTVEMGSGSMLFNPSFIKIGSGIQKLFRTCIHMHAHTQRQQGDLICPLLFFQNEESRLKNQSLQMYQCILHLTMIFNG
jgi:hypothetical protein